MSVTKTIYFLTVLNIKLSLRKFRNLLCIILTMGFFIFLNYFYKVLAVQSHASSGNPVAALKSFESNYKKILIKNYFNTDDILPKLLNIDPVLVINFYFLMLFSSIVIFFLFYDNIDYEKKNKFNHIEVLHFRSPKIFLSKIIAVTFIAWIFVIPLFIANFVIYNNLLIPVMALHQIKYLILFTGFLTIYINNSAATAVLLTFIVRSKYLSLIMLSLYWVFSVLLSYTPLKYIMPFSLKEFLYHQDTTQVVLGFVFLILHTLVLIVVGFLYMKKNPLGRKHVGV